MSFDWTWNFKNKNIGGWQHRIVVPVTGVFIRKKIATKGDHDDIIWFSDKIGTILSCGNFVRKDYSFTVTEKLAHWYISNSTNSVCHYIAKDDYSYIKFDSPKNAVIMLDIQPQHNSEYIIGVLVDETKASEELLEC